MRDAGRRTPGGLTPATRGGPDVAVEAAKISAVGALDIGVHKAIDLRSPPSAFSKDTRCCAAIGVPKHSGSTAAQVEAVGRDESYALVSGLDGARDVLMDGHWLWPIKGSFDR